MRPALHVVDDAATEGLARRRTRRWGHRLLVLVVALLVLAVQWLLLTTYNQMSRTTAEFARASRVTTGLANIQREILSLRSQVEALPRTRDVEGVELRRNLFEQQYTVVSSNHEAYVETGLKPIRHQVSRFDRLFEVYRRNSARRGYLLPQMWRILTQAEKRAKEFFDREDIGWNDITLRALGTRTRNQQILIFLMAVIAFLATAMSVSWWRRSRSDLSSAYMALRAEIDERRAAEEALRVSEERFRSMVQNSTDLVTIIDARGNVTYQTSSVARVLGCGEEELIGTPFLDLIHPADRHAARAYLASTPSAGAAVAWRMRHRSGAWLHCETVGANLLEDANVSGFVLNTRDVTERRGLEQKLSYRALHDTLTDLPNRATLYEQTRKALVRATHEDTSVAILYLDLDDFKRINDNLGHAAGDDLLLAVSDRLRASLRAGDMAARLGGDEFAILMEPATEEEACAIAHRIVLALAQPFRVAGKEVFSRASIGIAVSDGSTHDVETLLRDADVAMYAVKNNRKGRYEVFRPELHAEALERIELEAELKASIDSDQFELHYQPIVEVSTGRAVALEALLRWRHPTRGLLQPGEFIEVAERSGLIVPLGRTILLKAARDMVELRKNTPGIDDLLLTVNISARQLMDASIVDDVRDALVASGLPPETLVLEISENVVARDAEMSLGWLNTLRELGVQLAIDDFGSGTTSLQHLKRFPITILKVDRAFVHGLTSDPEHAAFLAAIHRLASALGLRCVFEGVEHQDQVDMLKAIGFEMLQGFVFARPTTLDAIRYMLLEPDRAAEGDAAELLQDIAS